MTQSRLFSPSSKALLAGCVALFSWMACCSVAQLELHIDGLRGQLPLVLPQQGAIRLQANQVIVNGRIFAGGVGRQLFLNAGNGEDEPALDETLEADPAGPQWLEFGDGTHFHGQLAGFDTAGQELTWSRTDVREPIHFPTAQVARIVLGGTYQAGSKAQALVRFRNGDWLAADGLEFQGGVFQLQLPDGPLLHAGRDLVESISFSSGPAPECYEGPSDLAGWIHGGGWTYQDGALHTNSAASPIGRQFRALPDQVEYALEIEQDAAENPFTLLLHSRNLTTRGFTPGAVQLIVQGSTLRLWWQKDDSVKAEQTDLTTALRPPGQLGGSGKRDSHTPLRLQIFEDFPAGRLVVFVNGFQVGDWSLGKGKSGHNSGGVSFQPMIWNSESGISLSKIRVVPWSGQLPTGDDQKRSHDPGSDQVALAGGESRAGRLESISGGTLKLAGSSFPASRATMVVLSPGGSGIAKQEEAPPVARVLLARRGQIAASSITAAADGKLRFATSYGDLTLAPSAIQELDLLGPLWPPPFAADTLVFRSGDRLRGWLDASDGAALSWRMSPSQPGITLQTGALAGVIFGHRPMPRLPDPETVIHFRNGDWLAGRLITLDRENVVLDFPFARELSLARSAVRGLYFSQSGELPILDGSSDPASWMQNQGMEGSLSPFLQRRPLFAKRPVADTPWSYLDGAYTVRRSAARADEAGNGPSLGRIFEAMPQSVDCSFTFSSATSPLFITAQVFTEPDAPGYMLQIYGEGFNLYDLQPRPGGGANTPLQVQFGDKLPRGAKRHRVSLLADRPSGKVAVVIDGILLGQYPPKLSATPRALGCGIQLAAQPGAACTISDLWIAPWDGQLPRSISEAQGAEVDNVLLANGDEATGSVSLATPANVKISGDSVDSIDLPVERMTMISFGPQNSTVAAGPRLRLVRRGALRLLSYQVSGGAIFCKTVSAGELRLPLASVRELTFAPPAEANAGNTPARDVGAAKP